MSKRVRDGDGEARRTVLADVSFSVERGELVVLRGPSGSGKTTLLAVVGGMLSPTSGEVYLDGEPTSRLREAHRAEVRRRKVGFLFQDLQLIDALTALENVLLPEVPLHAVTRAREDRALALLKRFGVDRLAATPARSLSGGERQRVGIAALLAQDPPLLLLDEPVAHLDHATAVAVLADLRRAFTGRTVVMVSHRPDGVDDFDRIVELPRAT